MTERNFRRRTWSPGNHRRKVKRLRADMREIYMAAGDAAGVLRTLGAEIVEVSPERLRFLRLLLLQIRRQSRDAMRRRE